MMKYYLFLIMLIFIIKFIKNLYLMSYMYIMLLLLLFKMMFINYNNYYMNIYYWLGLDLLSYSLILLSIFITSLMFMVSMSINNKKLFTLLLLILLFNLILSFNSMNYFLFYLFFEISLIPTFILIMMFGYQPERLNASLYMMLYTLFASLPLLMILFILYNLFFSFNYFFLNIMKIHLNEFLFYFYMMFAFLIKLPMFLFHMWLPKAHVEAPISGSMILAGIMLKLGGYGLIRSMNMMVKYCMKYNIYFISLNLIGVLILSILCLRQNDLKVLVAYSSVIHMSLMLCSLMTMYLYGKFSSIFLMIGHGFCSPALFMLVNYFYIRSKTRNMFMNKGLINLFPSMMLWWFLMCMSNMAAPITLNLIGELMIIISLMNWNMKLLIILIMLMFFSASYSIFLFSSTYHGNWYNSMKYIYSNNMIEYKLMFMLWMPLNILILKLDMMI